jgi:hypothetical protein
MSRTIIRGAAAGLAVLIAGAVPAEGQRVLDGFPRVDMSDVTGPAVTSGDQLAAMFTEPGTVLSMYCPVAWGVRTTATQVHTRLASAELQPVFHFAGESITPPTQQAVLALVTASPRDRQAGAPVVAALTANNPGAARQANRLVDEMRGLFGVLETVNPLRPGIAAPTRLGRAVSAYNAFVDASPAAFLASPPQEFAAIHAVLNQLVLASLVHEGRPEDPRVVDEAGLACALPVAAPPPAAPPPPIEQAISMCILIAGEFREVAAIRRPEVGDTVVIVGGERRPLAEVYPTAARIDTAPWIPLGESVTIGGIEYQAFGVTRIVQPAKLVRRGQYQGFDYYVAPGEPAVPTVLYFAAAPHCEVQPFRAVETIRVRG